MPEMMNMHQPQPPQQASPSFPMTSPRPSPRGQNGFPEHLKHADMLGEGCHKLTGANTLFHAVLKGNVRGVRLLLDRGVSVNSRNDYGYVILTTALHIDHDKRRLKLFKLLLDKGADPHAKDASWNRSVMHWACVLGRAEEVQTLIQEVSGDLDLHDKDKDNHTALHCAVSAGQGEIVKMLVDVYKKFGVSVDIADNMGLTPYLHAKRMGYRDIAEYLHGQGHASVGHGDRLFRTPREWSQIGKFERQESYKIQTQEAINFAKIRGRITHVRRLENNGLPFGTDNSNGVPQIPLNASPRGRDPGARSHPGVGAGHRRHQASSVDRLSMSLPSLKEHSSNGHHRPVSANGHSQDVVDSKRSLNRPIDFHFRPHREAFGSGDDSAMDGSYNNQQQHPDAAAAGAVSHRPDPIPGIENGAPTPKGPGSLEHLMEMDNRARHVRTYRQSQFDETKASEYKHMLGDLNSIMTALADQQSRSFRKSVKYQRPETPKKKKPKTHVSTLAVIFGRDRRKKTHTHGSRSPKLSASKTKGDKPSSKKEKEASARKDKGEKAKSKAASAAEESSAPAERRRNVVPLLKVNDKVI